MPTPPRDPAVAPSGTQDTVPPTRPVVPQVPGARPLGSRYLLEHRIGRGATGHVWAGRRRDDGYPVAVKLLRSELAEDPDVVMRFLREKSTLTRLRHPNLVQVHDLVAEGEVLAIVMDLVQGEDLRRRATRGPLSRVEAAVLLAQTAGALAAVHAARVVHRDVKPENILVTERDGYPTALLTDFGIARALEGPALTRPTQLVGTPAYIAPELAVGRAPEPASDVYSLGVTAYELLAGHRPFHADSPIALLRAHVEDIPARPPGIDDAAWDLIAACLAKAPADRPSAAEAAVSWAAMTVAGAPPTPAPPAAILEDRRAPGTYNPPRSEAPLPTAMSARPLASPPAPDAPEPRRRWWPVIAAAVVLALLGASTGIYLKQRQQPQNRPITQQSTAPATRATYFVPVSVGLDANGTATLTWDPATSQKPGFLGFFVVQFGDGGSARPVTNAALPKTTGRYEITGLRSGRKDCFGVLAYGVTEAPLTPVPQACVTPR